MCREATCDTKNNLMQLHGYMSRQWMFDLIFRMPDLILEENFELLNLDFENRFRKINKIRHMCRMTTIGSQSSTQCSQDCKNKYVNVKSRDQIRNRSIYHDRNNECEMMDVESVLVL